MNSTANIYDLSGPTLSSYNWRAPYRIREWAGLTEALNEFARLSGVAEGVHTVGVQSPDGSFRIVKIRIERRVQVERVQDAITL